MKSKTQITHSSAGIASILLAILLIIIVILKVVEVAQMTTVVATSQTDIKLIPPAITLSTFQNDSSF